MTRRMLINAVHPAEVRCALVEETTLEEFHAEVAERGLTRGNIYFGIIVNIEPSLNAAFIDYGGERHGFLAIQDVVPDAYYHGSTESRRPRIEEVLEKGSPIVVQVTREPEGQKGAVLTTNLSLAGRYLVLTPFDDTRGVSRKVEDEETRRQIKQVVAKLEVPAGYGVIVRTNALEQSKATLARDLNALLRLWKRISEEARRSRKTRLLYSDQDLVLQALRDYLDASVEEVLVDAAGAYAKAEQYMQAFMPRSRTRLVHYTERTPLFSRYHLERQLDRIYERQADLPSGGSIVIDPTEALTAIDVNSGKSTRAASQEETAVQTNQEAAKEVARQLRLRDLGGLVVVDFIDMRSRKNRQAVERAMREAMKSDRARSTVGRISANGLLEINRQRLRQALQLRTQHPCPTCRGTGRIASPELVGLRLLRTIEARAALGDLGGVRIRLHPELADAIQNQRRGEIVALESEFDLRVEIGASSDLHWSERELEWIARSQPAEPKAPPKSKPVAEPESEAKPASKSRRRRRGGRKRSSDKAADSNQKPSAATSDSKAEAASAASSAASAPAAKKRRRRPRRKKTKATTDSKPEAPVAN